MSQAYKAAVLVQSYCQVKWPGNGVSEGNNMASTVFDMFERVFETKGGGSHKHIPADEYSAALGMEAGSGVFGYVRMGDDSLVLLTCEGPLAVVDDKGCRWIGG